MASSYIGFTRPSITEINDRIQADINTALPGQDATLRYSPLNVLATATAAGFFELYGYLDDISNQTNILTCRGANLDLFGQIWSVSRLAATYTVGSATVTGVAGYTLPAGTLLQTNSGVQFSVVSDVVLTSTSAVATLTALTTGNHNQNVGTVLSLVSPISGFDSTSTTISLISGSDTETDDTYRARILARIKNPPFGGSQQDYITWALSQTNVTRAWCYPLENGPGTVVVRFLMDQTNVNGIPLSGDVAAMQTSLNTVRPVCCNVTAVAPITANLNITVTALTPSTQITKDSIASELTDMLRRNASPGCTIYLSWIWEALSLATGDKHHIISSPTSDVVYSTGQIPVIGAITYL
jgi:uncharacterized phage protein gp47/JayE